MWQDVLNWKEVFKIDLLKILKTYFRGVWFLKWIKFKEFQTCLFLYKNKWASLECKKSAGAKKQPNQEYYVDLMNEMSFSRFIYPENKEEVLHELQQAFKP